MPQSAAQVRPPLRPEVGGRRADRAIIDAALAVNDAPTLDEAFAALVRTGQELLGADCVSVAVWDEGLNRGVIRAVSDLNADFLGAEITAGTSNPYRTVLAGEPVVSREISTDGFDPRLAGWADTVAYVGVRFVGGGVPPVTFHATWIRDISDERLHLGAETLAALGELTRVAYRTERGFRNERLLERLFETLPVAIGVADPLTHELVSVNEAFVRLLGFPEEQVVGAQPPYPWAASATEVDPLDLFSPNEAVETLFRHQDGRLIPVDLRRFPIPGPDGRTVAVVTLISDLSEQRRFEQQLLQSGKLATIGELAAGVAHEINNPLFAILGLIEFLLKEVEPDTKAHDRVVLIQQTGLEIKEIVRALLDFAREPSEERALISVTDAARETVELVRRTSSAKSVEIFEDYVEEPTPVLGSSNQLKQIFLNLVANANQALGGEGTIEVAVRREDDWVLATVSDNGPGMPEATLERIFEPFFTTKRATGGSGLGLSVSHGIAESHGGSLTAENRPEGGARFTLRLPVEEAV